MALCKPVLTPGFIDSHRDGIGQVEAAAAFAHGQSQTMIAVQGIENVGGQPSAFRAEQKSVSRLEARIVKRSRALGGEGEQAWVADFSRQLARSAWVCSVAYS